MADKINFCKSCNAVRADQFLFCPNCGSSLEEFVQADDVAQPDGGVLSVTTGEDPVDLDDVAPDAMQTRNLSVDETTDSSAEPLVVSEEFSSDDSDDDGGSQPGFPAQEVELSKGVGLSLTIVDEHPSNARRGLMIAAAFLIIGIAVTTWFVSLFGLLTDVEFLDGELVVAAQIIEDEIVANIEEERRAPQRNKGDREGGGGGGREEQTPPSKGRLVTQSPKPLFPPSPNFEQAKTSLPIIQSTEGDTERPITNQRAGIPTSLSEDPSSGPGRGGGIGTGVGPSQGAGVGTSLGNRRGIGGCPNPPCGGDDDAPTIRRGETVGVKVLSQPRAAYTDAARQAGIQGKVVLRVTFQADGSIGAISAVSGLPNGLTERAIAAARSIRFEPAKRNGVPYSVTRTIEYSFTIY